MPTNHVSVDKMAIGKKSGGKHWTKAQVEARTAAAEGVKRRGKVVLRVPDWLSDDARKIWARIRRQTAGMELLDNLDAEMLAIYCDAVARYRQAVRNLVIVDADGVTLSKDEALKMAQAWARIVAAYADKLGLTPAARARLVKKKADELLDEFEAEFEG